MNKSSIVICLIFFLLSGCSSILGSVSETVVIDSKEADMDVKVIDSKHQIVAHEKTPFVAHLKKGKGYFKREHYQIVAIGNDGSKYIRQLVPGISTTYFLNIIVPGGQIGMVTIDPYSGSMWTFYDDRFMVDEVK